MKKIASILLITILVIGVLSVSAFADAGTFSVSADKATVNPGDTVTVSFNLLSNPGIWTLAAKVSYDPSAFTVTSKTVGTVFTDMGTPEYATEAAGSALFDLGDSGKIVNVTGNGTIGTMVFTVKSDAKAGAYTIRIVNDESYAADDSSVSVSSASTSIYVVVPHTHTYGEPTWEWAADYSSATAKFACSEGDDTQTVNATVNSKADPAATCETAGTTVYTATASFGGKTYTDTKTKPIDALTHSYGEPTWKWSDDHKSATATFTCANDSKKDHVQTLTATVTPDSTPATCEKAGGITYTAKVTFNGKDYTEEYLDATGNPATGHEYNFADAKYDWSKDCKTCTATAVCKHGCGKNLVETVEAVENVTTKATCTTKGAATMTATFKNKDFATQTKENVELPALEHKWGDWEVETAATCTTKGIEKRVCANDPTHVEERDIDIDPDAHTYKEEPVIKLATDTTKGTKTYTCKYDDSHTKTEEFEAEYAATTPVEGVAPEAETALKVETDKLDGYSVVFYEVGVTASYDDVDGFEVTKGVHPGKPVYVRFSYPSGTDKADEFIIFHLLDDGTIEKFSGSDITKADTYMSIDVKSFSPFAIAYKKAPVQDNSSDNSGSDGAKDTAKKDTQQPDKKTSSPQTGDDSAVALWTVLFLGCGATAVVIGKKKIYNR